MSWMRTLGRVGVVSVVSFSMEDVLRKPMRRIAVAVIALALLSPLGADAQEVEVSGANAGWVSGVQYFYRGIALQKTRCPSGWVSVQAMDVAHREPSCLSEHGLRMSETAPRSICSALLEAKWEVG